LQTELGLFNSLYLSSAFPRGIWQCICWTSTGSDLRGSLALCEA